MVLGAIFEMLGAILVGARTAETIKNGIIPPAAFRGDAGVQMLAFTCALAGASSWVMWCTRHSAHVSSTYSLISAVAGVGVATAGASSVQWGWNGGKGLGAIFAGLGMAPIIAAGFGATIFLLIKFTVHMRKNPVPWAIYTSPFFFLIAGTICTLSIVYKGSPNLKLNAKPAWYIAAVTMGVGFGLFILASIFFVPFLTAKVINKADVRFWEIIYGPALLKRQGVPGAEYAKVPNYAVVQEADDVSSVNSTKYGKETSGDVSPSDEHEKRMVHVEANARTPTQKEINAAGDLAMREKLIRNGGIMGRALRVLRDNPMGPGQIYEIKNMKLLFKRLPYIIIVGALYGFYYDIHAAQSGIHGTPDGERMRRIYEQAEKYPNEVEHTYSFVQVITACTASFAHGANDIGNSVGPWAVIYSTWKSGNPSDKSSSVETWQLAVLSITISLGLCLYGYNIMKGESYDKIPFPSERKLTSFTVMGNKITYHSPSRGSSMEMGAAITVLVFSQFALPVSTSMCITGATVGVGLCNRSSFKAINWQRVGLLVISWIATIPIAGTIAGVLMGILLNTPHFAP